MVSIGAATDVGMVRSVNQDSYCVSEKFAVVADGMGGHNCGDTASRLAVDTITGFLTSEKKVDFNIIGEALEKANRIIWNKSKENPAMKGMGTTVVVCAWTKKKMYLANIGDSRCYRLSDKSFVQITKDHSLVQKLIDNGDISPEEAALRKDKNVLYRAVGCDDVSEPDYFEVPINRGDIFLLCSDGLTNCVNDDEISKCIIESPDVQSASEKLVDIANKNGGFDNITVVIIKFM